MIDQPLLLAAALGAYVVSVALEVELPDGRRITPTPALGPPVIALFVFGYVDAPLLILAPLALGLAAVAATRRSARAVGSNLLGFAGAFAVQGLALEATHVWDVPTTPSMVVSVGAGALLFTFFESARTPLGGPAEPFSRRWLRRIESGWAVGLILASTACLTVLVLPRLAWTTFVVMLLPVLAARYEFRRFGKAREAFDQTARALASLTEGAGYVPMGHQERVGKLCGQIAREMGLPEQTAWELEVVGRLHDVGAVSLPDPEDVAHADPELIVRSSAQFLEETGQLARYKDVLVDAFATRQDRSIEATILRVAHDRDAGNTHPDGRRAVTLR